MIDTDLSLEQHYIEILETFQQFPASTEEGDTEFQRLAKFQEIAKFAVGNSQLLQELKKFCIYEIIHSPKGYRFSGNQCYFRFLSVAAPDLTPVLSRIDCFIRKELTGRVLQAAIAAQPASLDIFSKNTFAEVGKILFNRIIADVQGAQPDFIKIVIKYRQAYPFNKRTIPVSDSEYYEELCCQLGYVKLPKDVYDEALRQFQDIFVCRFPKLMDKIEKLIQDTECESATEEARVKTLIDDCCIKRKDNQPIFRDITRTKQELIRADIKRKELKALYHKSKDVSHSGVASSVSGTASTLGTVGKDYVVSGLLVYYKQKIEELFTTFTPDLHDNDTIEKILKERALRYARTEHVSVDEIFAPYKRNMKALEFMIADTHYQTLYYLFFKIKYNPFYEEIYQKYTREGDHTEDSLKHFQLDLEQHEMNPTNLTRCFIEGRLAEYMTILEKHLGEAFAAIQQRIDKSRCLLKRKHLIQECLSQIAANNNELAINLIPIQIEGLFFELLENSIIYNSIKDVSLYDTILKKELVEKIQIGSDCDLNLCFEAVAYFKYYFNSVIRNTIAHGNYDTLIYSRVNVVDPADAESLHVDRMIALELLYDLNYMVFVITRINEIDTAIRYIDGMAASLQPADGEKIEFSYERLYDDLCKRMPRFNFTDYKPGMFINFEPEQLLFWIFNPTYENYMDKKQLALIRNTLTGKEFWEFVLRKVSSSLPAYEQDGLVQLKSIVNCFFYLVTDVSVKQILAEVNKSIDKL